MRQAIFVLLVLLAVRLLIASQGHSGEGDPPKFGDYEAQRHWMEITTALPVSEWYFNTTKNDLQYWGLDYPPLTAMHSWLCGKAAELYEPQSVALFSSRGYETPAHKFFMRATVIIADYALLFPAVWLVITALYSTAADRATAFTLVAAQPGLLVIDHGHFQYNNISIGLALLAAGLIMHNWDLAGAFVFALALNYKQMTLYYAPAFFLVLLARCIERGQGITPKSIFYIAQVGFAVVMAFALCWAPFLLQENPLEQVMQILHRVFPVGRGLYEDKVANLWCSISPLFKLQNYASSTQMVRICTILTLVGLIPTVVFLWRSTYKSRRNSEWKSLIAARARLLLPSACAPAFVIMLSLSAWSFFFFSFHVHEKTVLLPIVPLTIWAHYAPNLVAIANVVSTISMLPLLVRDGHEISVIAAVAAYIVLLKLCLRQRVSAMLMILSSVAVLAPHFASHVYKAPERYPDIFVLLLTCASFAIMIGCVATICINLLLPLWLPGKRPV